MQISKYEVVMLADDDLQMTADILNTVRLSCSWPVCCRGEGAALLSDALVAAAGRASRGSTCSVGSNCMVCSHAASVHCALQAFATFLHFDLQLAQPSVCR